MSRGRLGVVTTSFPRDTGDPAGAFVGGFARWLVGAGWSVEVIAAGPGSSTVDGIPVRRIDGRGLFYEGGAPDALSDGGARGWARAAAFQTALMIAAMQHGARWDAVVSHWLAPSAFAVEAALQISARPRRRHLAIAHSSDVNLLQRTVAGRAAMRWLSKRADLVYSARHLVVRGAPGRVVAMGIDPSRGGDRERGRRRFMLQRTTALFLGRLVPVKGVDQLLDALPRSLDLIVAGDGPLGAHLRRKAAHFGDRVRFVGEVRGEVKADLLAAADLLVVPSCRLADGRTEGTATVLLEGLDAGLPIVATRTGGAAEVISDGESGLLVDPEPGALRRALVRIADDEALRNRLSDRARRDGKRHGWPTVGPVLAGTLATV